jgi:hypothetical protein
LRFVEAIALGRGSGVAGSAVTDTAAADSGTFGADVRKGDSGAGDGVEATMAATLATCLRALEIA